MNKISKIKFLLTPILTAMLAFIMVVTSFSWYQIKSSEIKVEPQTVSVTTKAPEGDNAEIFPINDVYEYNKVTTNYIVANTGIINGYLGQTGLTADSAEDRAYTIFYKVEVTSSNPEGFSTLDYAYVDALQILNAKGEEIVNRNAEADSDSDYGLSEFRIIFLEKLDISSGTQYYFKKTNLMTPDVTDSTNKIIIFYIGVQFHDDSSNRFPYSDTKYIGSTFKLNIKFDSSVDNSFYKIAVFRKNESSEYVEKYQYDYVTKQAITDEKGNYTHTQYQFKTTDTQKFDIQAGDRIKGYNKLTRTYYNNFENWTNVLDIDNDNINDTYEIPEVPDYYKSQKDILNNYIFNVNVYPTSVKIYNVCPFTQYFIKGGFNSWDNVEMDEVNTSVEKEAAIKLYKKVFSKDQTLLSNSTYLKPIANSAFVQGTTEAGSFVWYNNYTDDNKNQVSQTFTVSSDSGAKSFFDLEKSPNNYLLYTTTFSSSSITDFCIFDSNELYYKNSFNDKAPDYKVLNGEWKVYLLLLPVSDSTAVTINKSEKVGNSDPVSSSYTTNSEKYRSVVIYQKVKDVAAAQLDFYIKGTMNSWSVTEKYKMSAQTLDAEKGITIPYYTITVYFDALYDDSGKYKNHEFKFSDTNWGVNWSTDGFAVGRDLPNKVTTQMTALKIKDILDTRAYNASGKYTQNNLRYYFGLNDENSNMANIKIVRSGTYTFYLFYDAYVKDTGEVTQDAYIFLTKYQEGNFAS